MRLSRIVPVFLLAAPFAFGASKEIQELQRDVAMLQDQVRTMQKDFGDRLVTMQTLVQTTLDGVNRTNNLVNVMENRFNDAMKQQQQSVTTPVLAVTQKLDQMSEDFRAVREAVLDMNTRMGKLDAKLADLQNLVNTIRTPPPPPPGSDTTGAGVPGQTTPAQSGPPAGVSADTLYSNGYRDYTTKKYDLAMQEFKDYLKYFPTTLFASNAQYYIGDIYYKNDDFQNALQAFDAVLERFSDGNKTPDAHYMKALSLVKLGRNDAAAAEFRDIIKRYPDQEVAAMARARLREMGLPVSTTSSRRKAR
ncbi:MAG TPA: outer membrane protein assembly factor BamD [Bryobacteraceae bacterium]|nr:outer membrane protein assembly factor BamD [Bryobacteraceae bacterium]